MNKLIHILSFTGLSLCSNFALADSISGVPVADFGENDLTVPCVEVKNLDPSLNGKYFDIVLERQGDSFSYELTFTQAEDAALCQKIANFSKFEDDDFINDDTNSPDDNPPADDSNPSDDPVNDNGLAKIFLSCEKRSDRSKISVNAKNLVSGNYSAIVKSGGSQAQSPARPTIGDEVEFDFDSDQGDIAEGATAISAAFIQNGTVEAEVIDEIDGSTVKTAQTGCLIK